MNSSDQPSKSVGFIIDRPSPNVTIEPATVLSNWRVMKVLHTDGRRTLHLTGSTPQTHGRVTTELVGCNMRRMQSTTSSGRVYLLAGAQGDGVMAEIAITVWLRDSSNDLRHKDVTQVFLRLRKIRMTQQQTW